jgi:hypothetical protein
MIGTRVLTCVKLRENQPFSRESSLQHGNYDSSDTHMANIRL